MDKFITDKQIRGAEFIEAVLVEGNFRLTLWGQVSVPITPCRAIRITVLKF
jgi:hypothetical protein